MITRVNVELFRFDSKVDYLPYYKKYSMEYKPKDTVLSLLNRINSIEKFAYKADLDFNLKINNLYVNTDALIADVVNKTSNELKIEPVSVYRAVNDLIIDKKDYLEKILFFKEYITPIEMDEYAKSYELDYYASNTYNIDRSYIGDHSLLIAADIIEHHPKLKEIILDKISSKENGIWYHTSLENRVLNYDMTKEYKIKSLFAMLPKVTYSGITANGTKKIEDVEIFQFFDGFNIAEFEGINKNSYADTIKKSRANYVQLSLAKEDLAPYSTLVNSDFSLKIAGEILLEAKDENADFLVVRGKSDLLLFDGEQKKIQKVVNREINLPVITQEQFKMVLLGEKNVAKLGFDKHKIKVSFL
ncbi:MAG: hypothetical protein A2513_04890 [Sulfurimonas sp. RIFOXYD12_FULL_33_39]|uniref:HdrB C-terminal domain-containing protein n=1 Tax=unclassified Sulfurimonas TaxID=2623549 RepID=UPI0008BDEFBB|nr:MULTISPECIES: DUF5644 domain-containing protein [unclassified Sulfurimonas]OHE09463.1 MAG: hypothetical protein A2513_04890 [Sulfurimonas sp. RIFOXYD12_FULL_33_39]OHE12756.1 MAG: hypothetical protein A2530_03915 [Sulfurimonas sp. RIFOXYD2_FULL_34_21]